MCNTLDSDYYCSQTPAQSKETVYIVTRLDDIYQTTKKIGDGNNIVALDKSLVDDVFIPGRLREGMTVTVPLYHNLEYVVQHIGQYGNFTQSQFSLILHRS